MVQIHLVERGLAAKMAALAQLYEHEEWYATQRAASLTGDLPFCAKCKRKVDRMARTRELSTGSHILVVECHGEQEVVHLTQSQLVDATDVSPGAAFAERKLLEA